MKKFTVFENPSDTIKPYLFNDLINDLKKGREIEFAYDNIECAITNSRGKWWFTQGKDSMEIFGFEEKELLVQKIETLMVSGIPLQNIFSELMYTSNSLYIL